MPDDSLPGIVKEPVQTIAAHAGKRVTLVDWHPLASHTVLSIDSTKASKITDVNAARVVLELANPYKGLVTSVTWSASGDRLATYAKDKKLRIFDPRGNACVAEVEDHQGVKAGSVVWAHTHDLLVTVGHGRMTRGYSLWDPRNMSKRLVNVDLDSSSSSLIPILDQDTSVLLLGSRGEGCIKAFEVAPDGVHALSEFKSVDPVAGLAALPKTSCNVDKNEIIRVLKLVPSKNIVVPIRFEIPRVVSHFQEDLYPPTWDLRPSMSSSDWLAGANNPPNKISLEPSA
ncbi:MAG: hypothetical protein Q8P67_18455 [archaeon]|nr:hypothetical protein [archaeon]